MNRFLKIVAFGFTLLWSAPSQAQQANNYWCNSATVPCPPSGWTPASAANPFPVNASVTASISGFPTIQSTGTPISVTTGGVTGTLPTGTVVVASNVGATNGAYCKLGASATTSDQLIPPNSWFAFTVGANTQLTCITSTSTTTVNMVGGSGLPTGSGGGGGGSGGGGAITAASGSYASGALSSGSIASGAVASGAISSGAFASGSIGSGAVASGAVSSGAYASGALAAGAFASGAGVDGWDLTQGAKADAAWTTGSGSVISLLKAIATAEIVTNRAINLAQVNGVALGSPSAYGTSPGAVNVPGVNAFVTNATPGLANNADAIAVVTASSTSPVPVNNYSYVFNGTTWDRMRSGTQTGSVAIASADPCLGAAKTNLPVSFTATASAQLIALSGSTKIYVCSAMLIASVATNFSLTGGTGTNCGTPAALIGTTSATNAIPLAANGGFSLGNGAGTVAVTGAGSELCIVQSGAGNIVGNLTYVQQ